MLKLLIADQNEEFVESLSAFLTGRYQLFTCGNGREALEILRRERCDILVLDPVLPEVDGLGVLRTAIDENILPMVLMVSSFCSDFLSIMAANLGVSYVITKPAKMKFLVDRIEDLDQALRPQFQPLRDRLFDLLLSLNLTVRHNGFLYLCEAILLAVKDPCQPVTKVIYPAVARRCGCTARQVERSIRSALEYAWEHRDDQIWQHYFGFSTRRPSNAAFIFRLAEELRQPQRSEQAVAGR